MPKLPDGGYKIDETTAYPPILPNEDEKPKHIDFDGVKHFSQ